MRPDRIVVGEVRDASALDMLQAMNTGHDGSICTVHSNGPRDTCSRLETLVLMAGMDLPVRAIREQVASAVDLIVHQARLKDGTRRITHVTEVERMEGDVITLQDIFLFDNSAGLRLRGPLARQPEGHRAAAEVPGEDAAQQRHRRPAALRHLDGLPMTQTVRRVTSTVLGLFLGLLSLALLAAVPASRGRRGAAIDHAQPTKGAVRLLVSVPGTDPVDYDKVAVSIAGSQVDATAVAGIDERRRASAPRSWRSTPATAWPARRIAEAKKAALAYLSTVPDNVKVGVVSFDDTVKTAGAPDARPRRRDARPINGLTLTLHTALYDGVLGALKAAGPTGDDAGQRKILVLSDGKDTTTHQPRPTCSTRSRSPAPASTSSRCSRVTTPTSRSTRSPARARARCSPPPTRPRSRRRSPSEADALARQIVVTAQVPAGYQRHQLERRRRRCPRAPQTFTASAYVPVRSAADIAAEKAAAAAPPAGAGRSPRRVSHNVVLGAVGAIGLGLLGVVGCRSAVRGQQAGRRTSTLSEQIQAYGVMAVPGQAGPRRDDAPTADLDRAGPSGRREGPGEQQEPRGTHRRSPGVGRVSTCGRRVAADARRHRRRRRPGGLPPRHRQPRPRRPGVRRSRSSGRRIYLKIKRGRRLKAFSTGLADTLQLMSGSLSAGLSLAQSIDTIVREGTEPISGEFRRVVDRDPPRRRRSRTRWRASPSGWRAGTSRWVVMAIRIQREVGGNLAELLLTVAATLREREYLRRHVRALSAEGRLSCYILGGLPPGFLVYLALSKPDYVEADVHDAHRLDPGRGDGRAAQRRRLLDVQGRKGGCVMSPVVIVACVMIFAALVLVFGAVGGIFKEKAGRQPLHRACWRRSPRRPRR